MGLEGVVSGAATGAAFGPWGAVIGGAIGFAGSLFGKKEAKYQPNPQWLAMREDVMKGIREGLEEGGYTWSDEIGDKLYRGAVEDIATRYSGAERRIVESMAPYGNEGAMGRTLTNVNIARAQEEAKAGRDLDVAQEMQKQQSYSNLLQLGAGTPDPNLPSLQADMFNAQQGGGNVFQAAETGLATYMNLESAQKKEEFWNKWFDRMAPAPATNLPSWT